MREDYRREGREGSGFRYSADGQTGSPEALYFFRRVRRKI